MSNEAQTPSGCAPDEEKATDKSERIDDCEKG
jgi:hypothetical protein